MGPDPGSTCPHIAESRQAFLLEGASNAASVGLDIGGTLCKVVFFEPDNAVGSTVDRGCKLTTAELHEEPGVSGRRNDCHSQGNAGELVRLSELTLRTRVTGQRGVATLRTLSEEKNLEESALSRADNLQQLENLDGNWGSEGVQNGAEASDGAAAFSREGTNGAKSKGGPEDSEQPPSARGVGLNGVQASEGVSEKDRCRDGSGGAVDDVENLWMSSHEPIVLPGKGTLHFKRFGALLRVLEVYFLVFVDQRLFR